MLSFASKLVRSIEHSAETIISGGDESITNDAYFKETNGLNYGFRVLSVKKDSQSDLNGVQSWFDYIIGINGHEIPTNYNEQNFLIPNYNHFINEISRNSTVEFLIWSAKGGTTRTVVLNINPIDLNSSLEEIPLESNSNFLQQSLFKNLGLSIQWTSLLTATYVYHILTINPNSIAEQCGLIEHSDYIIGAQDGLLATGGEDLLGRLILSKRNTNLELYVYNQDYDIVRPINIIPTESGLGAGVGYGILHRLPIPSYNEPGSVLFNTNEENFKPMNDLVNQHHFSAAPAPAPPIHGRKKKTHTANSDLLNYLEAEGEKSRKLDIVHGYSDVLPPPNK